MRLPYGFDAAPETIDDDPWSKLFTINEYLSDCEPVPPHLAAWLGLAIRDSAGDPSELMRRLGLRRKSGRQPHKHDAKAWLHWGERVCELESNGNSRETALTTALQEYAQISSDDVSRTQLQQWRDKYREARWESQCP